jgi:hypothetical protein
MSVTRRCATASYADIQQHDHPTVYVCTGFMIVRPNDSLEENPGPSETVPLLPPSKQPAADASTSAQGASLSGLERSNGVLASVTSS